jgi:ketosteroid isomerase-like protein
MATSYVFAECNTADKKALEAFDRAWTAAGQNGDKTALTAIYADDYVGFPSMQAKGPTIDATMATFERNKVNPSTSTSTADHYMINCSPVSATITHRNTTVSASGSTTYSRSVHILEKRDGKWQVVSNAGNSLDDNAIIDYMERDWNAAWVRRDAAWLEKNIADDATFIYADGSMGTKASDLALLKDTRNTVEWNNLSDMNIRVNGNIAIVTGVNHIKGKAAGGSPFENRVRYTDTYIKRDGRWYAWASHSTRL